MKITLAQLSLELNKKLAPLYVISGDEPLLKQEAITAIRAAVKQKGYSEFIKATPDDGFFSWETLHNTLYAYSLLAEKRLVELDLREATVNKSGSAILETYAEAPANDTVLVIDLPKLDDKITRSAWYKACEKNGLVVAIWPIPSEQLPRFIIQRAMSHYQLPCSPDMAKQLVDYCEGNLLALDQALLKMSLLAPNTAISGDLLQTILGDETRYSLFDFIDHLIQGAPTRTVHTLTRLRGEGVEPVLILWAITRELRTMAALAKALQEGATYDKLFQQYRVFAKRQNWVRRFLTHFNATTCWQLLAETMQIDKIIKGAESGDVWQALTLFCLKISMPAHPTSHSW